jgi:Arc/MetJ-type ribon-helix-helix transcriptional regulator
METMMSLRMSPELRRSVERIAKRRKCSASVVVRDAVQTLVAREENPGSFYDSIKDLIGVVHGGDPKLSENTGRKFTEMLKARAAKR